VKLTAEPSWSILYEIRDGIFNLEALMAYSIPRLSSLRLNYVSETSVELH